MSRPLRYASFVLLSLLIAGCGSSDQPAAPVAAATSATAPQQPNAPNPAAPGAPGTPGTPGAATSGTPGQPGSTPADPGATPGTPGGIPGTPGSTPAAPGGIPGAPGSTPGAPGGIPGAPGTPGSAPGTPGGAPGTPSGAPGTPGSAPGTPGSAPGTPGSAPGTPGSAPGTPGGAPGTPGGAPGTPGSAPGTPGGSPGAPSAPGATGGKAFTEGKITSAATNETIDIPPSVGNPNVKSGDLVGLGRSTNEWRSKATELIGVKRLGPDKPVESGASWLVPLLPFLGHNDVFQLYDQTKSWVDGKNLLVAHIQIQAFYDPADARHQWEGFPFHGVALTHFVGMSGAEDRNEVAARLPRTDPDAGVFGYDFVARDSEITDGTSNTILLIGSGTVQSPWAEGGGATVRGAREPYFGELTGFGSKSVTEGGALVVMADGSARTISKDIDPVLFRSLCTIHGGEAVDPAKLESMAPKRP